MNAKNIRAARRAEAKSSATAGASRSLISDEPISFARKDLRETPTTSGRSCTRSSLKLREQLEIVLKRFPETNSRIKRNRHGINAAL